MTDPRAGASSVRELLQERRQFWADSLERNKDCGNDRVITDRIARVAAFDEALALLAAPPAPVEPQRYGWESEPCETCGHVRAGHGLQGAPCLGWHAKGLSRPPDECACLEFKAAPVDPEAQTDETLRAKRCGARSWATTWRTCIREANHADQHFDDSGYSWSAAPVEPPPPQWREEAKRQIVAAFEAAIRLDVPTTEFAARVDAILAGQEQTDAPKEPRT